MIWYNKDVIKKSLYLQKGFCLLPGNVCIKIRIRIEIRTSRASRMFFLTRLIRYFLSAEWECNIIPLIFLKNLLYRVSYTTFYDRLQKISLSITV